MSANNNTKQKRPSKDFRDITHLFFDKQLTPSPLTTAVLIVQDDEIAWGTLEDAGILWDQQRVNYTGKHKFHQHSLSPCLVTRVVHVLWLSVSVPQMGDVLRVNFYNALQIKLTSTSFSCSILRPENLVWIRAPDVSRKAWNLYQTTVMNIVLKPSICHTYFRVRGRRSNLNLCHLVGTLSHTHPELCDKPNIMEWFQLFLEYFKLIKSHKMNWQPLWAHSSHNGSRKAEFYNSLDYGRILYINVDIIYKANSQELHSSMLLMTSRIFT